MTTASLANLLPSLVIVPLTLLPIINPLSGAPVFMATAGRDPQTIAKLARQVAMNCWFILVGSMLVGTYVLDFFGISLPIVRVAGGLLVAASAWQMLMSHADDEVRSAVERAQPATLTEAQIVERSFFPITFPLTTGPGTVAASIALGAKLPTTPAQYLAGAVVAVAGATLTVLVIYLVYRHAARLRDRLGEVGMLVLMRIMAFVLLCIGIEITWTGWAELQQQVR